MIIFYYGKSMYPTMSKFGMCSTSKSPKYKIGDIVDFVGHDKKKYLHRIVEIDYLKEQVFTTKGDNFPESKPYEIRVPIKRIKGKMDWTVPLFDKEHTRDNFKTLWFIITGRYTWNDEK